jgi:hypothetical protein
MVEKNEKINRKDLIYSKGHIYQLTEPESNIFYIGSSINLNRRMKQHKTDFYNEFDDRYYKPFYVELRRLNKTIKDCTKLHIKEFENITIRELNFYENEYIKLYENNELNFNINRACRTLEDYKDYNKNYLEKNKEQINLKRKEYREKNKEQIKLQKKEYREKNKEELNLKKKEYWEKNKEQINLKRKEKREENKKNKEDDKVPNNLKI